MKQIIIRIGYCLIFVGIILIVFVLIPFPSNFWRQGEGTMHWYSYSGLEVVNGHIQFTFSEPGQGEPTNDELTKLILDYDPQFFIGMPVDEMIFLNSIPQGLNIKGLIYTKYPDFGLTVAGFKGVSSFPRYGYGLISAILCLVVGLLLIFLGHQKTKKTDFEEPAIK